MVDRELTPLERSITDKILRWLSTLSEWWGVKILGGGAQTRGVPDVVGCYRGRLVALEVKRPQVGRLTALQAKRIEDIRRAGGVAEVVTSVDDARILIGRLSAGDFDAPGGAGGQNGRN